MITIISLNPCIDLTLNIPALTIGGSHRTEDTRRDVAGKAINVAYALNNLKQPCQVIGFHFTENGDLLAQPLEKAGIPYEQIPVAGSIRTNIKIFEKNSNVMTEINHPGDSVPAEAVNLLLQKIQKTIESTTQSKPTLFILSGSIPTGVDTNVYGKIISQTKVPTVLDTYGKALLQGLEAGAFVIKPNLFELESTFNVSLPTRDMQVSFCRELLARYKNLRAICLSMGGEGAMIIGETGVYYSPPLDIPVRGVQGAGDSLVAGMALEISGINKNTLPNIPPNTLPLEAMLRSAVAMASASVICEGTLIGTQKDFEALRKHVKVEKIAN